MDDGSVEIAARKLLNQLSELFKTHPRENQWTKDCQPMAKVHLVTMDIHVHGDHGHEEFYLCILCCSRARGLRDTI